MLINHTLRYLPAQLLSPAAQLISMVLWTHWLAPSEMGLFTLVTVAQEMAYIFCIGWFSVYALRYLPAADDAAGRQRYLGTENVVVLASVFAAAAVAVVTAATLDAKGPWMPEVLAIAAFFSTRALNAHYSERARAQSAFLAYSVLQMAGPVGGLGLGWWALQHFEPTALVLLCAYATAQLIGTLLAWPMLGMYWRLRRPDTALLRAAIAFGAPMLGLGALGWVGENYIRYLVQWQQGATTLGLMVVGWSLGRRCASVASMLVAPAAFPLAARLFNEGRRVEALAQLRVSAALLVGVLMPVTAGVALLGPTLVALTVAAEYRQLTTELLGLSMLAGTVRNLHLHVTDQLMVLERRLRMLAEVDVVEIVACVVASVIGLRLGGLHGAVIGQGVGSLIALALSMAWAHSKLGFRWPWFESLKVLVATAAMAGALLWLAPGRTAGGLLLGVLVGGVAYLAAAALLFAPQWRRLLAARRASGPPVQRST